MNRRIALAGPHKSGLTSAAPPSTLQDVMERDQPNIIVVVIDALRARNLGCYGADAADVSPNIDALANSAVVFERAFSTWNTTDPSLTCILSGKYPRSHGIMEHGDRVTCDVKNAFAETGTRLTAEWLKGAGYETAAVDWMSRWFTRGFDQYGYRPDAGLLRKMIYRLGLPSVYFRYAMNHLPILRCYRPIRPSTRNHLLEGLRDVLSTFAFSYRLAEIQDAASVTRQAIAHLKRSRRQPLFLFLHYWDTHTPYHCPRGFLPAATNKRDPKSLLTGRYHGSVRYVDQQLGRLFAMLKQLDLWDNTLLVITSDHGDSLTEHEIYFDHHGLYDESTHVPLLINYPARLTTGSRVQSFVQHVDLLPTLCDAAGVTPPSGIDGYSLFPLATGSSRPLREAVFSEESYAQRKAALRTDKYKFIQALDGTGWCRYCRKIHVGAEELYDLQEDPHELHNVLESQPAVAQTMRDQLHQFMKHLDNKREQAKILHNPRLSPALTDSQPGEEVISRRLKSLGYLSEP